MVEIGAHESDAFNLLKLNCKINDELVLSLGFRSDKFVHDSVGSIMTWSQD
jgi:hypothetical protein